MNDNFVISEALKIILSKITITEEKILNNDKYSCNNNEYLFDGHVINVNKIMGTKFDGSTLTNIEYDIIKHAANILNVKIKDRR